MRLFLKIILAASFLLGSVYISLAGPVFVTGGNLNVKVPLGVPRSAPAIVYVDNVARSIDNLVTGVGGSYLGGADNTVNPTGALIVCNGDIRFGFGGVTPTATLGVLFPSGSSWVIQGNSWIDNNDKLIAAGATDNVACPGLVLFY